MSGKSGFTVLLASPDFIARGDFDAQGKPLAAVQGRAPGLASADAPGLASAALALGGKARGAVWVLSTHVALSTLEASAARMFGLAGEELGTALAFEGESFTGRPALEYQTSARLLRAEGEWQTYWLAQTPRRLRGDIEAELARRGTRVAGLLHPGGASLAGGEAADVVELWPEQFIRARRGASGEAALELLYFDGSEVAAATLLATVSPETPGALISLLSAKPSHFASIPPATHAAPPAMRAVSLAEPAQLAAWLGRWGAILAQNEPPVPVLRSPKRMMSLGQRGLLSAVAGLVTITLCIGHWTLTERAITRSEAELKTVVETNRRRAELQTALADREKLRRDLEAARVRHRQELESFPRLLAALGALRPEGLLVRSIGEEGSGVSRQTKIVGVCLKPELAGAFANALAADLLPGGWEVRPAKHKAALQGGTPLWDFEIALELKPGARASAKTSAIAQRQPATP